MNRLKYVLVLAAALSVLLCGCSAMIGESSGNSEVSEMFTHGISKEYWKSASYSMDDIKAKVHPTLYNDEREFKPDDYSDGALRAYNSMLGYAERIVGTEYYVYDYYYEDWTEPPYSWVIKIVPYEMERTAESEERKLYFDEPITLFYKEDGSSVQSCLGSYLMEQKWFDDLSRELTESFPDYRTELRVSVFEVIYPNVLETQFDAPSDYTYIINDSFYDRHDERNHDNVICVILPSDMRQDSATEVFEQIKPLLTRYCVTDVDICTITEDWVESFTII